MKKTMRKILSLALVAILLVASIPAITYAVESTGTLKLTANGSYVDQALVTGLPVPYVNGSFPAFCGDKNTYITPGHLYNVNFSEYTASNRVAYLINSNLTSDSKVLQQLIWKIVNGSYNNPSDSVKNAANAIWDANFEGKLDSEFPSATSPNYTNIIFFANTGHNVQPILVIVSKVFLTVQFDTVGGTPVPSNQTVEANDLATLPLTPPVKDDFTFDYWMLDGSEYDFSTPVTENITLVAHYTPIEVTTESTTEDTSQVTTENSTEASSEVTTENSTEASSEITTENSTEASSEVITETFSETTQPETQAPTEPQGPQGNVIVNFVDTEGTTLATSFSFTGTVGTLYQTSARTIADYELVETPSNAGGTFIDGSITVDYIYSNGETVTEEATPLGDAIEPITLEDISENEVVTSEEVTDEAIILDEATPLADALPQTGQATPELFYGIGGIVSALGIYLKKKNK